MNVEFAVIADYAAVTGEGKLIVAGIFDRITASELPAVHATMSLALRAGAEIGAPSNHTLNVRFVAPDGTEVMPPFEGEIRLLSADPSIPPGAQFILAMPGVRFERYGLHQIEIRIDRELVSTVALRVVPPSGPPMAAS